MMAPALPFFAPLFAEAAMSARTKNLRRAWAQQSASVTGPGERPSAYSLLYPEAVLIFAGLSVADLFLYWSRIGHTLNESE